MPHAPLQRLPADVILDVLANGRVQSVLRRTLCRAADHAATGKLAPGQWIVPSLVRRRCRPTVKAEQAAPWLATSMRSATPT
jgi:hypothetical protein